VKLVAAGSSSLHRLQAGFQRALLGDRPLAEHDAGVARLVSQPGFAVYRNTVLKGCVDALQANYPAVTRLVGEEWMRAAAAVYARVNLPRSPVLLEYGEGFPYFLEQFEPAADLPYLADVALLDRFWSEAHIARDEAALGADVVAVLTPAELGHVRLRPHAAARWAWFGDLPIFTIWSRNRDGLGVEPPAPVQTDIVWRGEGALLVRPHDAVQALPLAQTACVFLNACAAGATLTEAALAALAADPAVDLAPLMTQLLEAGAFGWLEFDQAGAGSVGFDPIEKEDLP